MFNNDTVEGKRINKILVILGVVLIVFLVMRIFGGFGWRDHMNFAGEIKNTISVSGTGEVVAIPDIATVSFAVVEQAKSVAEAQTLVTKKMDSVLSAIKKLGIEDKDIKTADYSAYPRYEYFNQPCTQYSCPPSRQTVTGYEVRQSVFVKIRKIEDAGKVLGNVGEAGVSDISGIDFVVDNQEAKTREARQIAITDAKEQAKQLAKDLGVKLGDIVSFSETGNYPQPIYMKGVAMGLGGSADSVSTPQIPTGENKIVSNVMIVYEIK